MKDGYGAIDMRGDFFLTPLGRWHQWATRAWRSGWPAVLIAFASAAALGGSYVVIIH